MSLPEGISFNWSLFGLKELRDYDVTVVDMHVPSFSVGVKCHNQGTSDRWRNDRPKSTQIWMDSLCSLHFSFLQTIKKLLNINELNSPWMRGKLKKSLFWHPLFFFGGSSGGVVEEGLVPTAVPCTKSGEPQLG